MTDGTEVLRERLLDIKRAGFAVPDGVVLRDLALDMVRNIGSTDPELRDDLIHATLSKWIIRGVFDNALLEEFLGMNLDEDHLFFHIGEGEEDSVFKRSFCALNVAALIYRHRQGPFLDDDRLKRVKERFIEYYSRERDLRGYVGAKGWAHSAAHGADALDELALCECMDSQDLLDILNSVRRKVCVDWYTFINQEDERMTTAVVSALTRGVLQDAMVIEWLAGFTIPTETSYPERHAIVTNVKGFLRSLYFRLLDLPDAAPVLGAIRETLSRCR